MNNTLDKETFAAFQGSSPFFKKCVSLVHKIARQASLIKSKIEISDFEIAKKTISFTCIYFRENFSRLW